MIGTLSEGKDNYCDFQRKSSEIEKESMKLRRESMQSRSKIIARVIINVTSQLLNLLALVYCSSLEIQLHLDSLSI